MSDTDRLLEIVRERGILRAKELDDFGIARKHLTDALKGGQLIRLGRGIYAEADVPVSVARQAILPSVATRKCAVLQGSSAGST
jgi:hypothetical protein